MRSLQELTEFIKTNITNLALLCAFSQTNTTSLWLLVVLIIITLCIKIIISRYEMTSARTSWLLVHRTYKLLLDFTIYYFTYIFARKVSMFLTYLTSSEDVHDFVSLVSPIVSMILLVFVITLLEYGAGLIIIIPSNQPNSDARDSTSNTSSSSSKATTLSATNLRLLTSGGSVSPQMQSSAPTQVTQVINGNVV
jgi:hypothetical protein